MTRSSASDVAGRRLERRVAGFVAAHGLLQRGQRVLLLLSGGADSMALLALVGSCDRQLGLGLELGALHVDYAMRGADSVRDRRIVEEACAAVRVPLQLVAPDVQLSGADFQERARRLRLTAARRLLVSGGYDVAATGHNLDDQAETVLYRLAKYGAPSALVGMPPRAGRFVRPLLCLRAAEVRTYCGSRAIAYGDDYTNAQQKYARNVVRLAVLPQLERLNPRAAEALAAAAETARRQQELLDLLTEEAWSRVARPVSPASEPAPAALPSFDLSALAREPEALRALLLRRLAHRALGEDALLERRVTQALLDLAAGRDGTRRVRLRGGWQAVREYDRLTLLPAAQTAAGAVELRPGIRRAADERGADVWPGAATPPGPACAPLTAVVPQPGGAEVTASFCGRRFVLRRSAGGRPEEAVGRLAIGCQRPVGVLTLRHPAPGDRFAPLGLGAETSVARFLREQKVPLRARRHALVIELGGRVAWVETPGRQGPARRGAPGGMRSPAPPSGAGSPAGRVAESFRVTESSGFTLSISEQTDSR